MYNNFKLRDDFDVSDDELVEPDSKDKKKP